MVESAIWLCHKAGMAARRAAACVLGPDCFSCIPGLDARGDKLWAESAKWATEAFNPSGTTADANRRLPREVYTGKEGPFRLLPFFPRRLMRVVRKNKHDDQAVPCHYLNGGDSRGECVVKVVKAETGYICYTSNVSWASQSSSGGGGIPAICRLPLPRLRAHAPRPPLKACGGNTAARRRIVVTCNCIAAARCRIADTCRCTAAAAAACAVPEYCADAGISGTSS